MRFQLPFAREMARSSSIHLFAERPSHPSVPLEDASAIARRRGQGRPLAGARALPLTAASTMARSQRPGGRACARIALLLVAGVIALVASVTPAHAQRATTRLQTAGDPFSAFVTEAAQRFGIPTAWILAIMHIESRGDRRAISPKGAMGLMQLMPDTWAGLRARYGLGRDPYDPRDNILAGAAYLREMHDRYGEPGFLAAYNAGPGRYEDYRDRRRPLPGETIAYVAELLPLIDGGDVDQAVLTIPFTRFAWAKASLFVTRPDGAQAADRTASDRPSRDASAAVGVRDVSAIAPQSKGLFVALSSSGRTP
jgi:soluble lytic murein transglycosylase-like protein